MIAKPRIKDGSAFLWAGIGLFVFAVLLGAFAAANASGAAGLAAAFAVASSFCLFVGFWRELFYKIELRLIDIQAAVKGEPAPADADDARP